ncbi:MAG: methyltransferase [Chitinispirillales bacterium]|jgi:23S rRNA (uracil1939-C5)-methyltransferase|nr:methyltransferase [Chitinispirillales bacterium]
MNIVKIEKLVFGGYGLGRGENGVVLIPGVAPGEVVEYEGDGSQGGAAVGRVLRVVDKSPKRRDAPCVYAGECGGCGWLHLSYDEQVRCKKEIFLDCIDRIGKFERPDDIENFTADEFGYRMRAQVKVDHQNRRAGFYRRKSNDVVRIDKCPLLVDEINDVLMKLNSGMACRVPDNFKAVKLLAGKNIASYPRIDGLTGGDTEIDVAGVKFLADGGSFFQSNRFLLETLGRWGSGFVDGGYCLDLYGGVGFFSLMLADNFDDVVLVENVAAQVKAAKRNFAVNGKNHLKAVQADVERGNGLAGLTKTRRPDCVIVDPPRPGLVKDTRKWLIDTAPAIILYVSCNPSTFARDAGALIRCGYELRRWALFDLYPNTHHIESAGIFCK